MNKFTLSDRVTVPDTVLTRELAGESVLMDLASEAYFGLDSTAALMWRVLTESASIETALVELQAQFDVDAERLQNDLEVFITRLLALGLLRVEPA